MRRVVEPLNESGKVIHRQRVRFYAHLVKSDSALFRALPDERRVGHACEVRKPPEPKAEATLAENLTALHSYYRVRNKAKDQAGPARPASDKALAEATGIARKTIEAARRGTRPLQIDNIQKIARAYGLEVHHLLAPGLDPSKPPIAFGEVEIEAEVDRRVRLVLAPFVKLYGEEVDEQEATRPGGRSPGKPFGDLKAPTGEPGNVNAAEPQAIPAASAKKSRKR